MQTTYKRPVFLSLRFSGEIAVGFHRNGYICIQMAEMERFREGTHRRLLVGVLMAAKWCVDWQGIDSFFRHDAASLVLEGLPKPSPNSYTASCTERYSSQFKDNCSAEMQSGSKEGSYLRLIDCCVTQL